MKIPSNTIQIPGKHITEDTEGICMKRIRKLPHSPTVEHMPLGMLEHLDVELLNKTILSPTLAATLN